jgi:hypothetical protein
MPWSNLLAQKGAGLGDFGRLLSLAACRLCGEENRSRFTHVEHSIYNSLKLLPKISDEAPLEKCGSKLTLQSSK